MEARRPVPTASIVSQCSNGSTRFSTPSRHCKSLLCATASSPSTMKSLWILAFIIVSATCAPAAAPGSTVNIASPSTVFRREDIRNDWCQNSSFENKSSPGSPIADDCEQIRKNIEHDGGWQVPCDGNIHE